MVNKLVNGRWIQDSNISILITYRLKFTLFELKAHEIYSFTMKEGVDFLRRGTEFNFNQTDVEDIAEKFEEEFDVKHIILILTKLSLFDFASEHVFSVHRLVQEVIKDEVKQSKGVE